MTRKLCLAGYGAFELKQAYQRNLGMALAFASLLLLSVMVGIFLFSHADAKPVGSFPPPDEYTDTIEIFPPPTITQTIPTPVWTDGLSNLKPAIGQPVPVKDEEILTDVSFATQKQLGEIGNPDISGILQNSDDRIVYKPSPVEEILPTRDEFVPYDENPVPLNECTVEYPPLAREAGIEGIVWIKALVDKEGNVRDAFIFKSSGTSAGFEEVAQATAFKIKYKPAISNRQPVAVWVVYTVSFKLK